MATTLGAITFDETYTQVRERLEEVGGRDAREIILSGLVVGESNVSDIESRLDAILDAASDETFSTALSLRPGRELYVRRTEFVREVNEQNLTGNFRLTLEARDPFEWSDADIVTPWTIDANPDSIALSNSGSADALPTATLVFSGADRTNPSLGDGARAIVYSGVISDGQTLVADSEQRLVTLDGTDVTPYTLGEFPRIAPGGATLSYADNDVSAPSIACTITQRDRWW